VSGVPRAGVFAVPAFSTREALNYLSGRLSTDPDQRSGAIDLAAELGGDPAALTPAAAVILSSGTRCSEYRQTFARHRAQIAPGAGLLPAAAVTWALSAWYAGRVAPGGGTWPLLALAALLGGPPVPGTVFTASATCQYLKDEGVTGGDGPQGAWFALQALQQAGLLSIDAAGHPAGRVGEPAGAGGGPRGGAAGSAGPGCCWRPATAWPMPGWPGPPRGVLPAGVAGHHRRAGAAVRALVAAVHIRS
jgi:hypothetical protein